ncbi:hypothetical protein BDA99DRAFT_536590 [Phascolomyces articulosus]|uniref:Uncharacterized protein n=1 Tax=Phascolomyces articulosus TaxID=60185 RepID=A0AAD5PF62_9FUNG|nr:hypothetical protein BDA99DRAFT_536590 [Phascolomyces articulosus]
MTMCSMGISATLPAFIMNRSSTWIQYRRSIEPLIYSKEEQMRPNLKHVNYISYLVGYYYPISLSKATEKVIKHMNMQRTIALGAPFPVERILKNDAFMLDYNVAFIYMFSKSIPEILRKRRNKRFILSCYVLILLPLQKPSFLRYYVY